MTNAERSEINDSSLDVVLRRAEAAVAALGEEYLVWARNECKRLLLLHRQGTEDPDKRQDLKSEMHHAAHNLKGQGRSFGFDLVTDISELICGILRDEKAQGEAAWTVLGAHFDALDTVLSHAIRGSGGGLGRAVIGRLKVLACQVSPLMQKELQ